MNYLELQLRLIYIKEFFSQTILRLLKHFDKNEVKELRKKELPSIMDYNICHNLERTIAILGDYRLQNPKILKFIKFTLQDK